MRLLDTNVIVYAHGQPHAYKEPCRALIQQVESDPLGYTIDTELLQEIIHVYNVRGERAFGLALFDALIDLFPDPLSVTRSEMLVARRLLGQYPALSPRDAIHAAVVLTRGLDGIISTDKAFRRVPGLGAVDPADLAGEN